MQIECTKAVCIFHFAACVISCSPFRATEETKEKQCIHIALGSRRPGRSIINQRSINTAHNVNPTLIFKAVDTCNEKSISTKYFYKVEKDEKSKYVKKISIRVKKQTTRIHAPFLFIFPPRNMKREFYSP